MTPGDPETECTAAQDWTALEAEDLVTVIEPQGRPYGAWIEDKTPGSDIVWIRRIDVGSRHLIEQCDGIRIVRQRVQLSE